MYSNAQLKAIIITPMVTGLLSAVASGMLITTILKSETKLSIPSRRILFGLCLYGFFLSFGCALSSLPIPKGQGLWGAMGNVQFCDFQGFISHIGMVGSALYNCNLSIYYLCVIRFSMSESTFCTKVEPLCHLITNLFALASATYLLVEEYFNSVGNACWIGAYPTDCLNDPEVECLRGNENAYHLRSIFIGAPLYLIWIFIVIAMVSIIVMVFRQKRRIDQWASGGGTPRKSIRKSPSLHVSDDKYSMHLKDPLEFNLKEMRRKTHGRSLISNSPVVSQQTKIPKSLDPLPFDVKTAKASRRNSLRSSTLKQTLEGLRNENERSLKSTNLSEIGRFLRTESGRSLKSANSSEIGRFLRTESGRSLKSDLSIGRSQRSLMSERGMSQGPYQHAKRRFSLENIRIPNRDEEKTDIPEITISCNQRRLSIGGQSLERVISLHTSCHSSRRISFEDVHEAKADMPEITIPHNQRRLSIGGQSLERVISLHASCHSSRRISFEDVDEEKGNSLPLQNQRRNSFVGAQPLAPTESRREDGTIRQLKIMTPTSRGPCMDSALREVTIQALLYIFSFVICWTFPIVVRMLEERDKDVPFAIYELARILHPIQGLFNILIYCRPFVSELRSQNPEYSWWKAFSLTIKSGGDNDSLLSTRHSHRQSAVQREQMLEKIRQNHTEMMKDIHDARRPSMFDGSLRYSRSFHSKSSGDPLSERGNRRTREETLRLDSVHDDEVLEIKSQERDEDVVNNEGTHSYHREGGLKDATSSATDEKKCPKG